jgi:hypothetical protein
MLLSYLNWHTKIGTSYRWPVCWVRSCPLRPCPECRSLPWSVEEALCCGHLACRHQPKVDGLAVLVDSAVEVFLGALDTVPTGALFGLGRVRLRTARRQYLRRNAGCVHLRQPCDGQRRESRVSRTAWNRAAWTTCSRRDVAWSLHVDSGYSANREYQYGDSFATCAAPGAVSVNNVQAYYVVGVACLGLIQGGKPRLHNPILPTAN